MFLIAIDKITGSILNLIDKNILQPANLKIPSLKILKLDCIHQLVNNNVATRFLNCIVVSPTTRIRSLKYKYDSDQTLTNSKYSVLNFEEEFIIHSSAEIIHLASSQNFFITVGLSSSDSEINLFVYKKGRRELFAGYKAASGVIEKRRNDYLIIYNTGEAAKQTKRIFYYDNIKKVTQVFILNEGFKINSSCEKDKLKNVEFKFKNLVNEKSFNFDKPFITEEKKKEEEKNESIEKTSLTEFIAYSLVVFLSLILIVIVIFLCVRRARLKASSDNFVDRDMIYDLNDF